MTDHNLALSAIQALDRYLDKEGPVAALTAKHQNVNEIPNDEMKAAEEAESELRYHLATIEAYAETVAKLSC